VTKSADGRERARFYKDRGYEIQYIDCSLGELMAEDGDLLSRANSLINADSRRGRQRAPATRAMRGDGAASWLRRRSGMTPKHGAAAATERRGRGSAVADRSRPAGGGCRRSGADGVALMSCVRCSPRSLAATARAAAGQRNLPALIASALDSAGEQLRQGIRSHRSPRCGDFLAQRGQLPLPLPTAGEPLPLPALEETAPPGPDGPRPSAAEPMRDPSIMCAPCISSAWVPMDLAKSFEPAEIERRWYPTWEERGYFGAGLDAGRSSSFCILLPPPNVTGTLHMGHGFNQAIMDALTRYHRMRGDNTLWQPGTDHAGIATQIVVERQLDAEGVSRHDLGREKFLQKVWQWKEFSGSTITRQMRRLGTSPDWSRERFTMDAGLSRTVTETFVQLYREGLIYRGKRLVNWDPVLQTAVSDLEVVQEEERGQLWHIRYPLADGSASLVVATTRPETMLGDTAVMVHPDDERYRHLLGRMVRLPLCGREIPIIADAYVDLAFGTGCVKVTPAHDFNDYAVASGTSCQ
jgi:hypothetical protein